MIISCELVIMYIAAIILSIPGTIVTRYLKKIEPPLTNQTYVDFNPFSLKTS